VVVAQISQAGTGIANDILFATPYFDTGRIISVTPAKEKVTPRLQTVLSLHHLRIDGHWLF
jgi:hypothetical protein